MSAWDICSVGDGEKRLLRPLFYLTRRPCCSCTLRLLSSGLRWHVVAKADTCDSTIKMFLIQNDCSGVSKGVQQAHHFNRTELVVLGVKDTSLFVSDIFVAEHMGASQNRRSGTSSGTTPVPYPRSIPPFHTSLKDPFHTSVPYLWSIRYYIIIIIYIYLYIYIYVVIYIYICIYIYNICIYIYIYTWICAVWFYICTRILECTYTHECVHARIGLLCPSPVIVLSSLCLQRLLCDGRDVLGCCQLAV